MCVLPRLLPILLLCSLAATEAVASPPVLICLPTRRLLLPPCAPPHEEGRQFVCRFTHTRNLIW